LLPSLAVFVISNRLVKLFQSRLFGAYYPAYYSRRLVDHVLRLQISVGAPSRFD
jgi:hypothetical protein